MPLLSRRSSEDKKPVNGSPVPRDVEDKIKRGREAMLKDANFRKLCEKMWDSDQYAYMGSKGILLQQSTVTTANGGKPPHRVRKVYNYIKPLVASKVSAATQRVPSYEVVQTTSDHRDYAAARLAEKVAVYLYDEINIRRSTTELVTNALVQREGFLLPYFDANVGPFIDTLSEQGEIETTGMGQVKLLSLTRSEVMWEPGVSFEESRWHGIERERLIEEVEKFPGYVGGSLTSDVTDNDQMVTVTEYLERPCPDYPDGRRMFIANKMVICPEEDYPLKDVKERVIDRPVPHRLSFTVNPNGDERGMVETMIDPQQTVNDCTNKLIEWKNRCLNPQWRAPRGSSMDRPNDVPGAINYYNPVGGQTPEQERPLPIPQELFQMREMAIQDLRVFAADVDVQPDPRLTTGTATAAIEQAQLRWQSFLGDLAQTHSGVMRALLTLVARHYSDERLIEIRGQYSWEAIPDFKGQNLYGQVHARVRPQSLEARGPTQIRDDLTFMQTFYPGAIPPEAAWTALQSGYDEGLLKSYDLDVAAAARLVELLRQGAEVVANLPPRFDPDLLVEVPGWMPRKQHNIVIFKQVIGDAMKSPGFDDLPVETQHRFDLVWSDLERLEQARAMAVQQQEMSAAADLGLGNAAKPQVEPPMPNQPGLSRSQADPAGGVTS